VSTICAVGYKTPNSQFAIYSDPTPIGQWYFTANGTNVTLSIGQVLRYPEFSVTRASATQITVIALKAGALTNSRFYAYLRNTSATTSRPAFNFLDAYYTLVKTALLNTTGLVCPSYDGDYTNDLAFRDGSVYTPSIMDTSSSVPTDATVNAVQLSWASTKSIFNAFSSKDGCPAASIWGARRALLAAAASVVTPDAALLAQAQLNCTNAGIPINSPEAEECAFDVAVTGGGIKAGALVQNLQTQPVSVLVFGEPSFSTGETVTLRKLMASSKKVAGVRKGGGQELVFKGLFSAADPVRQVLIGGLAQTIVSVSTSQVKITTKPNALSGGVDVVMVTASGLRAVSRSSIFVLSPTISSVLPARGGQNTQVVISGRLSSSLRGLGDVTKVWLGRFRGTIVSQTDTKVIVLIRNLPRVYIGTTVDVTVISTSLGLSVLKDAFRFV